MPGIESFYVTFGVQYTGNPETGETHPLGFTKDNYVVIEAPSMEIARGIAAGIFGDKYAFIYDWANFMGDGTYERWYAANLNAHALTIKWVATPQGATE